MQEDDVKGALRFTGKSEHGNERYYCRLCDKHLDAWPSNPSRWRHWHARTHGIATGMGMTKFYSKRPTRVKSKRVLPVERTAPPPAPVLVVAACLPVSPHTEAQLQAAEERAAEAEAARVRAEERAAEAEAEAAHEAAERAKAEAAHEAAERAKVEAARAASEAAALALLAINRL